MRDFNKSFFWLLVFLAVWLIFVFIYGYGDISYYASISVASIMYGLLLFISNKSKKDNLKVISMMCAIFGLGFIFRFYQIESFYLFLHGLSVFVWLQFALNMFVAHNKIE